MVEFNENFNATLDRGQQLEVGIEKSNELAESSNLYKKKAVDVNRTMCWRKYMVYIIGTLIVLGLIGLIILIVKI